jgi:hypothetical protein
MFLSPLPSWQSRAIQTLNQYADLNCSMKHNKQRQPEAQDHHRNHEMTVGQHDL